MGHHEPKFSSVRHVTLQTTKDVGIKLAQEGGSLAGRSTVVDRGEMALMIDGTVFPVLAFQVLETARGEANWVRYDLHDGTDSNESLFVQKESG